MKLKISALILAYILVFSLVFSGCSDENGSETNESDTLDESASVGDGTADTDDTADSTTDSSSDTAEQNEYGILADVIDKHGFPFKVTYTEGMEIIWFEISEEGALRQWRHSLEGTSTHENLSWKLTGNTFLISGDWNESFEVDMERGTLTSASDGTEYRLSVKKDKDASEMDAQWKWYVEWESDAEGQG